MQRWVPLVVLTLVFAVFLAGVAAQEEGGPFPEPLDVGPGANRFYIFGSISDVDDPDAGCGPTLMDVHGNTLGNMSRPYATNNPADPCALDAHPTALGNYERALSQVVTGSGTAFTVYLLPDVSGGRLEEGAAVGGEVTLYYTTMNDQVPLVVGQVKPRIQLTFGNVTLGPWDGAPAISPTELQAGADGGRVYVTFAFDLGTAPATPLPGPGELVIEFPNAPGSLRFVGTKVGIAVDPEHRGHVDIPFVAGSIPNPNAGNNSTAPPDANITLPGGNGTGNGNMTGPDGGNGTADGNGTGDGADLGGEKKGSPSPGVALAVALVVAAAAWQRRGPRFGPAQPRS